MATGSMKLHLNLLKNTIDPLILHMLSHNEMQLYCDTCQLILAFIQFQYHADSNPYLTGKCQRGGGALYFLKCDQTVNVCLTKMGRNPLLTSGTCLLEFSVISVNTSTINVLLPNHLIYLLLGLFRWDWANWTAPLAIVQPGYHLGPYDIYTYICICIQGVTNKLFLI